MKATSEVMKRKWSWDTPLLVGAFFVTVCGQVDATVKAGLGMPSGPIRRHKTEQVFEKISDWDHQGWILSAEG